MLATQEQSLEILAPFGFSVRNRSGESAHDDEDEDGDGVDYDRKVGDAVGESVGEGVFAGDWVGKTVLQRSLA